MKRLLENPESIEVLIISCSKPRCCFKRVQRRNSRDSSMQVSVLGVGIHFLHNKDSKTIPQ